MRQRALQKSHGKALWHGPNLLTAFLHSSTAGRVYGQGGCTGNNIQHGIDLEEAFQRCAACQDTVNFSPDEDCWGGKKEYSGELHDCVAQHQLLEPAEARSSWPLGRDSGPTMLFKKQLHVCHQSVVSGTI